MTSGIWREMWATRAIWVVVRWWKTGTIRRDPVITRSGSIDKEQDCNPDQNNPIAGLHFGNAEYRVTEQFPKVPILH